MLRRPSGLSPLLFAVAAVVMLAPAVVAAAYAQSAPPDGAGDDDVKFLSPMGISIHFEPGMLYVTDTGNHRVQVFNYSALER